MFQPVSVVPCGDYQPERVRQALEKTLTALDIWKEVRPGMKIAVKANLITVCRPEKAATTHPVMLAELCRLLTERGAEVTVGDSPGGPFTPGYVRRVYAVAGLKAVEEAGARLNDNFEEREADFPEGVKARKFLYTAWLDEADLIINFAKLKTHAMMGMSAAVKNLFGTIPGTVKPEYHFRFPDGRDFAHMLVDLNVYFHPALHLIDAVVAMEGNGPTAGTPRQMGCLLGSRSSSCADLLAARLIGLSKEGVPTLAAGIQRGLCPETAEELTVLGEWQSFCVTDYQVMEKLNSIEFRNEMKGMAGRVFGKAAAWAMCARPRLQPDICVGCGECGQVCPAHAITMEGGKPRIDTKRCIRCFCCQEFCPKGAMRLHRPAVARLLNKH